MLLGPPGSLNEYTTRPSCKSTMSRILLISCGAKMIAVAPPLTSRLITLSPDLSVTTNRYLCPSGDQLRQQAVVPCSLSKSLRTCPLSTSIAQATRSEASPWFVLNEMADPSGDTAHAVAWSRSFRGVP